MKRKTKRSSRRDYGDQLWRQVIRARDVFCQMSDETCEGRLEAAHIIRRGTMTTRHIPDNGVLLCAAHHRIFDGIFDKHSYAKTRLGEARWAQLCELGRTRWDRDLDTPIEKLKAELKCLEPVNP